MGDMGPGIAGAIVARLDESSIRNGLRGPRPMGYPHLSHTQDFSETLS